MRKKICIALMLCLFGVTTACGTKNETSTEIKLRTTEPTVQPTILPMESPMHKINDKFLNKWYGVGIYDRCYMETEREGDTLNVKITWGNSASSTYEYEFSGTLQNDVLNYSNLVEKEVITDEEQKVTEKILNQDLSGEVYFHDTMALWDNNGQTVILATEAEYIEDATKVDYTGKYGSLGLYERVTMDFSQKDSEVKATIYWSDSYDEEHEYTFTGTIDGNQAILNNIKTIKITYQEDGSKQETDLSQDGTGTIFFSKNFIVVMDDQNDFVIPFIK